jgi:CheY-like chemotaxis protein
MKQHITIFLAEDDEDDILLFKEALSELQMDITLITVQDGEQLMMRLHNNEQLPKMVFLDVNMPRKNGFACLAEIKLDKKLKPIPIIILSTSSETKTVSKLYETGAQYFIRKPNEFSLLKNLIKRAIILVINDTTKPGATEFVLREEVLPA